MVLGFMTAISPCPMATNMAAIAFVSRRVEKRKYAVLTGLLYTLGRMFSYSILGVLIIATGLETPWLSSFFQGIGEWALGPLLLVVGLGMLVADKLSFGKGCGKLATIGGKVAGWGMGGGFLLGAVFALAFCPYSAVLYFGMLIPLSLKATGGMALPAIYAVGTGFPVLIIGTLLSAGIAGISSWLNALSRAERVIRVAVALVFVGIGIYYIVQWLTI